MLTGFYGSSFFLNKRIKEHGLPTLVWVTIAITSAVCLGVAIATYLATRDFIAPLIFIGIGYLLVVGIATMADMARRRR